MLTMSATASGEMIAAQYNWSNGTVTNTALYLAWYREKQNSTGLTSLPETARQQEQPATEVAG